MKKTVKISGKDYFMKSSAFTQFKYKDETGRKLLQDLKAISKLQYNDQDAILDEVDDLVEILLKISYVMINEADSNQVGSYEEFLKEIGEMFENTDWIGDVVELAASPISRGI